MVPNFASTLGGHHSRPACVRASNLWRLSSGDTTASLAVRNMWQFLRMLIIKGSFEGWMVLVGFGRLLMAKYYLLRCRGFDISG